MKALARRQYLPRLKIAGISLLVGLIIPSLILLAALRKEPNEPLRLGLVLETLAVLLVQLVTGAALLAYRSSACECYDPNSEDVEERLQKGRARAVLLDNLVKAEQEQESQGGTALGG
jgi:hypothetical protein